MDDGPAGAARRRQVTPGRHGFGVSFGAPRHGWMDIELATQAWSCAATVSHVPYDTLADLIAKLYRITSGSRDEVVEWSLEPDWWRWQFHVSGSELRFSVDDPQRELQEVVLPAAVVLGALCRGLLRVAAEPVWRSADADEAWLWPFRHDALARLRARAMAGS